MSITQNISTEKLKGSQTAFSGEIPANNYEQFRSVAIRALGEHISIDGFRKGKIPENILVKHVGEQSILIEIAERAVSQALREIVEEQKLEPITQPEIQITKLATGNPIGFRIIMTMMPEITLPDYTQIAKQENTKKMDTALTDKEVEDALMNIRKAQIPRDAEVRADEIEKHLPELTDEFVKTLGDFKDVADFTGKLREHLEKDKKEKAVDKKRGAMAEAISDKTKLDMPAVFVESELAKMLGQLKADVGNLGVTWESYLKKIEKTEEQVVTDWRPDAEKRAKLQLVLAEIARLENLSPDTKEVQKEIDHLIEHYPDADRERVHAYVTAVKTNQKVWEFLDAVS
jgi:FKBP-type peptidyl-prolyl cis-trans isomerase (trigger factor)